MPPKSSKQQKIAPSKCDAAVSWPRISKKKGLTVQDISGDASILVIDGAFTAEECKAMIDAVESLGLSSTYAPPRKGYAYRDNDRILLTDTRFAAELWATLSGLLGGLLVNGISPVGLNEDLRVYRYKPPQRFGPHIDENVTKGAHRSEYTVLIYLTGGTDTAPDVKGGHTSFLTKPPVKVAPRTGRVCVHWQLHNCLHEGEIVERGEKWVLRSDLMY